MSAFGFRLVLLSTVTLPVTVVVGPPGVPLVAPVITRDGTPGTSPFSWVIQNDDSFHEGYYWNVQRATSVANLTAGTLNANVIQQVKSSDLYGDPVVFDELGSTPIGDLALRMRIGYDNGAGGYVWGPWSNILTDTIAASFVSTFDTTRTRNAPTFSADNRTMISRNVGYQSHVVAVNTVELSAPIGYAEMTFVQSYVTPDRAPPVIGLAPSTWNKNTDSYKYGYLPDGATFKNGGYVGPISTTSAQGGVVGVLVHKATGKFWLRTSSKWEPGVPSFDSNGNITGDAGLSSDLSSFLLYAGADGGDSIRINCGQDAFNYALPANVPKGWA